MNSLSTIFHIVATVLSVCALMIAFGAWRYAKECVAFVNDNNERSLGLSELATMHVELTEQRDSIEHIMTMLKKLRSRMSMRQRRAKDATGVGADDSLPDPKVDPDGWKRAMRIKLFTKGKQ